MMKKLIYDGKVYSNFLIDENGNVLNIKTKRVLKKSIFKDGYYHITLPMGKNGRVKSIRVHKAVAETFIPNQQKHPIVHHKDENRLNCCRENLEWTDPKMNIRYHWEKVSETTDFYNNRKLTKNDVEYIRKNKGVISSRELACMFNVSKTTISNVQNHKLYN